MEDLTIRLSDNYCTHCGTKNDLVKKQNGYCPDCGSEAFDFVSICPNRDVDGKLIPGPHHKEPIKVISNSRYKNPFCVNCDNAIIDYVSEEIGFDG